MGIITSLLDQNWKLQAEEYLISGNYVAAATLYEQLIELEPENKSNYWYLGLMLLLQGKETEAQMTWFMALAETQAEELYTAELLEVLQTEAERRTKIEDYEVAWAIRQHIRELAPQHINNLLYIIQLSMNLDFLAGEDIEDDYLLEIIESLPKAKSDYNSDLLLETLLQIVAYGIETESVFKFAQICLENFPDRGKIIDSLMIEAIKISVFQKRPDVASRFAELCLQIQPNHREILTHISFFYQDSRQYLKGIESAKYCYEVVTSIAEKVTANFLITRGLMTAGSYWQEACTSLNQQELVTNQLIQAKSTEIDEVTNTRLFTSAFFFPYLDDNPRKHRYIQNQVVKIAQCNITNDNKDLVETYNQNFLARKRSSRINKKTLNIGYLSHCFKKHSVGWLCRWLFQHHDHEKFKIHIYSLNNTEKIEVFTQRYFVDPVYKFDKLSVRNTEKVWDKIHNDEIDILVDLDSITLDSSCEIMSMNSAPIQVTWLGWDASGLPSIDYFIADPYVLPESAQDYYSETIWRLPQTYIAVDGFEVDVPNLRREHLDIPSDAIVYLMTQKGYKRHLEQLRLQLRIIKEVPSSYLLIKGEADLESSKKFFDRIAQEEGADFSRLRFLSAAPSEAVHRGNLSIADVVLDTFPYNGATTTLETLWMCIPIVTRVGQQFAARNSYTMMINAGITEGIAWNEEEYVEWGVRLGQDEKLRQKISWKLRQSRHTAPLWNARQFTREMEKAYEQMWQRYLDS